MITTSRVRQLGLPVIGCLFWAFLVQAALEPGWLPVTAGLAGNAWALWSVRIAVPLLAGLALTRRYQDWPAVATLGTIAGALVLIDAATFLIPQIAGFLDVPSAFIAMHSDDRWSQLYPDGPPEPSHVGPIVLGILIGLLVAVLAWSAVVSVLWLGVLVRTSLAQLSRITGRALDRP